MGERWWLVHEPICMHVLGFAERTLNLLVYHYHTLAQILGTSTLEILAGCTREQKKFLRNKRNLSIELTLRYKKQQFSG